MTKTYKVVLRSSFAMLSLLALAVVSSGVAQAQECVARAKGTETVRAEGITEVVGSIELRCRRPDPGGGFGFQADIPDELDITVELNTPITNEVSQDRIVEATLTAAPAYDEGGILLEGHKLDATFAVDTGEVLAATVFAGTDPIGGELTEDGTAIEWTKIPTSGINLTPATLTEKGFNLLITGIRANASMMGDGEDIMATVLVGGAMVGAAFKVADVTTGLEVEVDPVAEGLQCSDADSELATITIQEGFTDAIFSGAAATDPNDSLVVTFTGIPAGVTVVVPAGVPLEVDDPNTSKDENAGSFSLTLRTGSRTDGVGDIEDGLGAVEINLAGAGEIIYDLVGTAADVDAEQVKLPVTFTWKSGGDMPAMIGAGYVDVSFHPVSTAGVSFDDVKMPRFAVSDGPDMVVKVDDCVTTLLFPFVTNQNMFDTGLVITNTSTETGSCTIDFSGSEAPADMAAQTVIGGEQWVALASVISQGFQGYITATCGFQGGYGFAFLTDGYGGVPTLAQSYLAVRNP